MLRWHCTPTSIKSFQEMMTSPNRPDRNQYGRTLKKRTENSYFKETQWSWRKHRETFQYSEKLNRDGSSFLKQLNQNSWAKKCPHGNTKIKCNRRHQQQARWNRRKSQGSGCLHQFSCGPRKTKLRFSTSVSVDWVGGDRLLLAQGVMS
jgi:hypothetical protein